MTDISGELAKRISRRQFLFGGGNRGGGGSEAGVLGTVLGAAGVGIGVMALGSPKAKSLAELGGAPTPHDNTDHSRRYLELFNQATGFYVAADVTVDGLADYVLDTVTLSPPAGIELVGGNMVLSCNVRLGTAPANDIVDVWWDIGGTQRSRKFPVTVRDTIKSVLCLNVPLAIGDVGTWNAFSSSTLIITVKARRQVADADIVLISDRTATGGLIRRDIP